MIKKAMILAMGLMLTVGAFAQGVIETVATVGTMTVPAMSMNIDTDAKLAQEAMRNRLKEAGLKTKNNEGYLAAIEQVFAEVSATPISFFAKVEEQGRRKNKVTVVTVCAIPTDLTQNQAVLMSALRSFLEGFPQYIERYQAQQNMEQEQGNLRKAEKAAASAASAVANIDQNIASMQSKIERLRAKIKECEDEIADLERKISREQNRRNEAQQRADEADNNVRATQNEVERYRQMAQ